MERPPDVWQEIRRCFTNNLVFNEERGKKAAGIGILKLNGETAVYTAPLPASQFVQQPDYHRVLDTLDAQTTLILGHARHPTKGSPQHESNNHPLQVGTVIGVHNGHIHNDDDLFARRRYPRQAEVDSEIIFQLLWRDLPAPFAQLPLTAVRKKFHQLEGKLVTLAADSRQPESLLIARRGNPLSLHYHTEWRVLIFSSRYIFLRKTFGRSVLYETLPDNHLFLYNAGRLAQYNAEPVQSQPCDNT